MQRTATATDRSRFVAPAIAAALLILAIGMLLSGGKPTKAATDTATQGVSADILSSIDWNPASCNAATTMPAQTFSVAAGGSQSSLAPSVGCVSSNDTWDVSAQMTTAPTDGVTTIPASAFTIQSLDTSAVSSLLQTALSITGLQATPLIAGGQACTTAGSCALNSPQLIIDDATANTIAAPVGGVTLLGGIFAWSYRLDAPSDQPAGSYTAGEVTLTASNGP